MGKLESGAVGRRRILCNYMWPIQIQPIVIISDSDELMESICRYFRTPGKYLVCFEAPKKRMEKYGVYHNDCIRVANATRSVEPAHVIFAFQDASESNHLQKYFYGIGGLIYLNSLDEEVLKNVTGFKKDNTYKVSEKTSYAQMRGDVIAVEVSDGFGKVIGKNLATAECADIVCLPTVSDEDREKFNSAIRGWNSSAGIERDDNRGFILTFIKERVGQLANASLNSLSFITKGISYGIYPFFFSTTHYFSFPLLGVGILNGILKSKKNFLRCPLSVLVDPELVDGSEFNELRDLFLDHDYIVRACFGERAKARKVAYITEHLPCDFIIYSTHCSELPGRRIKERFVTTDRKEHVLCYDQAATFSPEQGEEMVEVLEFKRWISIDGIGWDDDEGKRRIGVANILEEYIDARDRKNPDVVSIEKCGPIEGCSGLGMSDFNFIPMLHDVGGHFHPLVFNNTCSSWKDLALRFWVAGTSAYIGTSLDIPNPIAISVVNSFFKMIVKGKAVGPSLFKSQSEFTKQLGYTPFLLCGYHYTKIPPLPISYNKTSIIDFQFDKTIKNWQRYVVENPEKEGIRDPGKIIQFLKGEKDLLNL